MTINEANAQPPQVYTAPAVDYPPHVAAAIGEYEAAHQSWAEAFANLYAAQASAAAAGALDEQALVDAVAAGKAHPGTKHDAKARAAVDVANEIARVARVKATAATDMLKGVLAANTAELVPAVLAAIRAALAAYDATTARCQAQMEQATNSISDAMGGLTMIRQGLRTDYGINGYDTPFIEAPRWPSQQATGSIGYSLDNLERLVREAKAGNAVKAAV